jgi:AAA ATPase domain
LERLASALSEAASGRPTSVLVAGDAGVGKSRVVAEFLARARASLPVMVLEGGCTDLAGTGLPYEPIAEALRSLARQLEPDDLVWAIGNRAAELSLLAPELAAGRKTDLVLADPAANRQRVFGAVVDLLLRLADRQPTLVIQEDIHWADASTRQLLAFLMRKVRTGRIVLVATFRSTRSTGCIRSSTGLPRWSGCPGSTGSISRRSMRSRWPSRSAGSWARNRLQPFWAQSSAALVETRSSSKRSFRRLTIRPRAAFHVRSETSPGHALAD